MGMSRKVDLPWFMRRTVKRMRESDIRHRLLYPNGAFNTHSCVLNPRGEQRSAE